MKFPFQCGTWSIADFFKTLFFTVEKWTKIDYLDLKVDLKSHPLIEEQKR